MKKIYFIGALLAATMSFGQVTLPHYEGFGYTVGSGVQTQTGWAPVNTGDDLAVTAGSLSFTGLQVSTGDKVTFAGSGIDALKSFTTQTGTTIYYSLLLNVSSMAGVTDVNGGYFCGFQSTTANAFGGTLWAKRIDDNSFNLGLEVRTNTGAATTWGTATYVTGQTYFIVVSYTLNSGSTTDDVCNLWVDPVPGAAQPAATITDNNTVAGSDLANLANFLLRQDSTTETPSLSIDELRIGSTWAEVTPSNLSIAQNNISGLKVYPNPAKNTLYVTSDSFTTKEVQLYDVLGKSVLNTKTVNNTVNISSLSKGVYVVKITEEGKTATRKIVIE